MLKYSSIMVGGRAVFWVHGGMKGKELVSFVYKDKEYLQIISAKVLEDHFGKGNIDLYAFVPHSIYVDDARGEKERQEKDIEDFVEIPLPSMGRLKGYSFNGNYHYIKFWIFLNLLKVYFEKGYKEYYCDISQGLNVYVDAFKEAFRSFVVFDRLYNFGKDGIKVYVLYSDPILRGVEEPHLYDDIEIRVKVWFDSPIKVRNLRDKHNIDAEIKNVLKNFYRAYRAIRFNIPPLIHTFGYDKSEKVDNILKKLLESYLQEYSPGHFQTERKTYEYNLPPEPDEKISIFLALALYRNISLVLEERGIVQKKEFTLEDLRKFFEVYEHYGLQVNRDMLQRDIDSLRDKLGRSAIDGQWKALGRYVNTAFRERTRDDLRRDHSVKRNFFAHSGMENNCVYVRKSEKGQLLFKYKEEVYDLLDSFVYEE